MRGFSDISRTTSTFAGSEHLPDADARASDSVRKRLLCRIVDPSRFAVSVSGSTASAVVPLSSLL